MINSRVSIPTIIIFTHVNYETYKNVRKFVMYYNQLLTTNEQPKSSTIASNRPVVRSTPENSDKRLASFNLLSPYLKLTM